MHENKQPVKDEPRIKNKFILFSAILFLVILIAGSLTVIFMPDSFNDFKNTMTIFILIVFIIMLAVFIVFNIFIAQFIKSLNKTMDSLEIASKAKSTFLTNMSHEIRTPMNAIIGITDIMMQTNDLPDDITEGLSKIYGSCDLLLGIINDILDFSKIEAGVLDVMPAQYSVASLINDTVHLNTMKISEKPIEFVLKVEETIPAKLIGDELRIKQVLNNLLSNSYKYTETGNITLSVTSETDPDKNNVTLVFTVKDTGSGMTKDQLEKLFDEYTRFSYGKRNVEGTGLGLAITQRLIYLMNGEIQVDSEPGIGTIAVIRLPQEPVDDETLGFEVAENLRNFFSNYLTDNVRTRIEHEPMPYGKILIVDDVETNIYVAVGLMQMYELTIETATSGFEAINKIKEGKVYDIIFMDHMMPEMDGMETTRKLRVLGYTDPIVALTANAVTGQSEIFLQNGFDDFLSKPIDIRKLNSVLIKFIKSKQPREIITTTLPTASNDSPAPNPNPVTQIDLNPLLMASFIRDADKTVATISNLLENSDLTNPDDLRSMIITVHGIKSALSSLKETELSSTASRLEEAGRNKNLDLIITELPGFNDKLKLLLKNIKPEEDENTENEDPEDIIEILHELKKLSSEYNRRGTLNKISEVKTCSGKTKTLIEFVKDRILHSEYEEAETAITSYIDKYRKN